MAGHINRIDAITKNARNTWFALLAALVFVGVTLLSVEPVDFYGVGRATELPLVGVSVPTNQFFYIAPMLILAIYGYFHIYLIRLWDVLSDAPPRIDRERLSDAVAPWLITDSALCFRRWRREDNCRERRTLDRTKAFFNAVLIWCSGPAVLAALWWLSLPARKPWMSGISGLMLVVSLAFLIGSVGTFWLRMRQLDGDKPRELKIVRIWQFILCLIVLVLLAFATYEKTNSNGKNLATLNLVGEEVMKRPAGWVPYPLAKVDFFQDWCKRDDSFPCNSEKLEREQESSFEAEWRNRRKIVFADIQKPSWNLPKNVGTRDFSSAYLRSAFLVDANFRETNLNSTNFARVQMEGADLSFAKMKGVKLRFAQMQMAEFSYSYLTGDNEPRNAAEGWDLSGSLNKGGALRNIDLTEVKWDKTTDFRNVFFDGSVVVPDALFAQMGYPCQITHKVLDDKEFFLRWSKWIQNKDNPKIPKWSEVAPIGAESYGSDSAENSSNSSGEEPQEKHGDQCECMWKTGSIWDDQN